VPTKSGTKDVTTAIAPDAFNSAGLKVQWAEKHISDMEALVETFHKVNKRRVFTQEGPEGKGVLFAFELTDFLPEIPTLQMLAGDAVHNLRSALDHLAWAIVSVFKEPDAHLHFPIATEIKSLVGQPSFREIQSVAPDVADLIVNEIKPYGAGNAFVRLNQLDRADKHRVLITHVTHVASVIYVAEHDHEVPDAADGCIIIIAGDKTLPRPGSPAAIHNENYRGAAFDIRFDPGLPFENEPVIPTLHQLAQLVAGVVQTLRAHCEPA
jgi:hypothetical protein